MLGKLEKIEEEVLEVVDLSKINAVKVVDAAFTFPNKQIPNKSTAIILFRDNKNHPFLIYIDEMDNNITLAEVQDSIYSTFGSFLESRTFELSNKITIKKNEVIFTIIDLDPPKPMTKEQIEKILGYKINIVT
jgi:hypothetical protein